MSKKLPDIYKSNNITSDGNNRNAFYSFKEDVIDTLKTAERNTIFDINEIELLFNIPVKIITHTDTITTKIVSKVGDHILTSCNRIILLKDIKNITAK